MKQCYLFSLLSTLRGPFGKFLIFSPSSDPHRETYLDVHGIDFSKLNVPSDALHLAPKAFQKNADLSFLAPTEQAAGRRPFGNNNHQEF